jgi:hypothetical protein
MFWSPDCNDDNEATNSEVLHCVISSVSSLFIAGATANVILDDFHLDVVSLSSKREESLAGALK